jgi:hypothetical protein
MLDWAACDYCEQPILDGEDWTYTEQTDELMHIECRANHDEEIIHA